VYLTNNNRSRLIGRAKTIRRLPSSFSFATMSPATSAKYIDPSTNMLNSMIVKVIVSEL
jgi:hypothetical protein